MHFKGDCVAKVVILGAGLTGLSAAYHFEKSGFFDYSIFEKCNRVGGLLKTHQESGYTFDHTGHFLHTISSEFKHNSFKYFSRLLVSKLIIGLHLS